MFRRLLPLSSILLICMHIGSAIAHCGTGSPDAALIAAHHDLRALERTGNSSHLGARHLGARHLGSRDIFLTVNLYMHIVETAAAKGTVTDAQIQSQMAVLQSVYNTYQISFNLLQTTRTVNDSWALQQEIGSYQQDMKTALRQGDYKSLNIYILPQLKANDGEVLLGDCTLPSGANGAATTNPDDADNPNLFPDFLATDGCRLVSYSFPAPLAADQSNFGANGGFTLVHEVGHWFGLLHTFEGDTCGGNGDFVDDTRKESIRTQGCPTTKNSCPDPSVPGEDPFHNYMDYATDDCLTNFTPGQITRALGIFQRLRAFIANPTFPTSVAQTSPTSNSAIVTPRTTVSRPTTTSAMTSSLGPVTSASPLPASVSPSASSAISSLASVPVSTSPAASSGPSSSTSAITSIATPSNLFFLNVVNLSPRKRQASTFLTTSGFQTTDQNAAAKYYILNGQLFTFPGGGQITTSPGVAFAAFDSTAALGSIRTTFTPLPAFSWSSSSFTNNPALFCLLPSGQVLSVFSGLLPTNCAAVSLVPFFPGTSSSTTNIANPTPAPVVIPGITFTLGSPGVVGNFTYLANQVFVVATTIYYNQQCGCLKTSAYTSALPATTVYTVTSTYYNQQCGCMSTTTYAATTTVAPVPVTVTASAASVLTATASTTGPKVTNVTGAGNRHQFTAGMLVIPSVLAVIMAMLA